MMDDRGLHPRNRGLSEAMEELWTLGHNHDEEVIDLGKLYDKWYRTVGDTEDVDDPKYQSGAALRWIVENTIDRIKEEVKMSNTCDRVMNVIRVNSNGNIWFELDEDMSEHVVGCPECQKIVTRNQGEQQNEDDTTGNTQEEVIQMTDNKRTKAELVGTGAGKVVRVGKLAAKFSWLAAKATGRWTRDSGIPGARRVSSEAWTEFKNEVKK